MDSMTNNTTHDEYIRAAVELVRAKARNRALQLHEKRARVVASSTPRPESDTAYEVLTAEIEEVERIDRLASDAWRELTSAG
jgi:hypothetical protein